MKIKLWCIVLLSIFIVRIAEAASSAAESPANKNILVTTFPIYQITRNVAVGAENINLDLMLPANLGCPHDYALSPLEMQKIENADILIINGLGMEGFLHSALGRARSNIAVIDSSRGIDQLIAAHDNEDDHDHEEDDHGHHHGEYNPHLFTSPLMAALIAENIAAEMAQIDSPNAGIYNENGRKYAEKLRDLASTMKKGLEQVANNRVVEPHGAFDYLARDIGLEIVAEMQPEGASLSASELLALLETVKHDNPAAIIAEPQYPERTGLVLSQETGLPMIRLDPVAGGPDDAGLDYYETVMRENMQTLITALEK